MNMLKLAGLAILLTAGTALAQEVEKKMAIKVMIADGSNDQASAVEFTDDSMDFAMQNLEIGETRTIESDSGDTISITRAEQGFRFDHDGESVMMPDIGAHGTMMTMVEAGAMHDAINVDSAVHLVRPLHPEGVTIVSGKPLDQSVKDSIRSVLISAGNNEEITFVDGSQDGQQIVVKKIEVIDH